MKFSIIIPVYNEEKAIRGVLQSGLAAGHLIVASTPIKEVEIIVVDDGSKDTTAQIARGFKEVKLISFARNEGYGAALKKGFAAASGQLLGFLDADGTCNPQFFVQLINALLKDDADIVIGSRLGPESRMPKIRALGNKLFALIISFFSRCMISDCASGMRVFKKGILSKLYPLPDGLHFTPAMSCKALMSRELKIIEIPIAYEERTGASKLSVIKDGYRFLKVILEMALFYQPLRFFSLFGFALLYLAALYSIQPVMFYLLNHSIEERYIYRLISIVVFSVSGLNFLILGVLTNEIVALMNRKESVIDKFNRRMKVVLSSRFLLAGGFVLALSGVILNMRSILDYIFTGKITLHWVYVLTGGFLVLFGFQIFTYGFLHKIINLYKEKEHLTSL